MANRMQCGGEPASAQASHKPMVSACNPCDSHGRSPDCRIEGRPRESEPLPHAHTHTMACQRARRTLAVSRQQTGQSVVIVFNLMISYVKALRPDRSFAPPSRSHVRELTLVTEEQYNKRPEQRQKTTVWARRSARLRRQRDSSHKRSSNRDKLNARRAHTLANSFRPTRQTGRTRARTNL